MSLIDCANVESGSNVLRVQTALAAVFGGHFAIWVADGGGEWNCLDGAEAFAEIGEEELQTLRAWFADRVAVADVPEITVIAGHTYIAAWIQDAGLPSCIVAGRQENDPATIATKAARLAVRDAEVSQALAEQEHLVEDYAQRLSDSFEELSFLRKLSLHVEHCVADRDLASTAQSVLPQLRELMMVEGLCLVEAAYQEGEVYPRRLLATTGHTLANERQWLNFLKDLGQANRHVIVCNFQSGFCTNRPPWPGLRSIVLAPIQKNGYLYGWLIGNNKQLVSHGSRGPANSLGHDEIGSMEATLLEAAALMLGTHAGNNKLLQEKESLIVDVIHTLVGVIEARDQYTCGHSDRVALIGRRIAHAMGLPREDCHDIFLSGLLHDIGKIGVSDEVLLKPGKLTAAEFQQIKVHPERGARLLRGLRPLEDLIPGVLYHHEAVDGSGYPHGLQGESIPLMARILAVADGFDAMTSDRPYRAGMPAAKAEAILREGSGKQWDPVVVEAFFSVRDDVAKICRHWQRHLEQLLNPSHHGIAERLQEESTKETAERTSGWHAPSYAELPSFVRDVENMLLGISS